MNHHTPQDDGIPRHRHEQLDQLARMFGEPEPLPPALRRTEPGVIVTFDLHWNGGRSRRQLKKLTDEEFAAYERARVDALPYVGEHVRQFDRPFDQWTSADLARLVADMLATLQQCPPPVCAPFDARTHVSMNRVAGRLTLHRLHIMVTAGREYRAEVDMAPAPIPERAYAGFIAELEPFQISVSEQKRGVATTVRAAKSTSWTPGQADPDPIGARMTSGHSQPQPSEPRNSDDDRDHDLDDDLDAIEKAARRALHGERNIPNTSRTGDADHATEFRAILDLVPRLAGWQLRAVRMLAEQFAKLGGQ